MVHNNKILTVSYGTFSCTLEGFDDSFDTMKAIAEYFRELASEDRYFGAEPPAPDTEMLARIAQREISRRVEARQEDSGGYVLRADPTSPEPKALTAAGPDSKQAEKSGAPDDPDMETAARPAAPPPKDDQEDVASSKGASPVPLNPFQDTETDEECESVLPDVSAGCSLHAAITGTVDDSVPIFEAELVETTGRDGESIAAKLQRIRAVVSGGPFQRGAQSKLVEQDIIDSAAEDMTEVLSGASTSPDDDSNHRGTETCREPEDGVSQEGEPSTPAESAPLEAYSEDALAASQDISESAGPWMKEKSLDAVVPEEGDKFVATGHQPNDPTQQHDPIPSELVEAFVGESSGPDEEDELQQALDRLDALLNVPDTDAPEDGDASPIAAFAKTEDLQCVAEEEALPQTAASGQLQPSEEAVDEAASPHGTDAEDAPQHMEDNCPNKAEGDPEADVKVESSDNPDAEFEDDHAVGDDADATDEAEHAVQIGDPDEDPNSENAGNEETEVGSNANLETAFHQPNVIKVKRADFEAAVATGQLEDLEAATQPTPDTCFGAESTSTLEAPSVDADEACASDEESSADRSDDDSAAVAQASAEGSPTPRDGEFESDEDDVSRLMAAVEREMDTPEATDARTTYDHLRGAVAAANSDIKDGLPDDCEEAVYRSDLADVVRPRRPVVSGKSMERPNTELRPAPLKLSPDQRVDTDAAAAKQGPVRPRRISTDAEPDGEMQADHSGFAEFASEMKAEALPDLLEAAAAYLVFVEGRAQFSRPQLMNKVRQVDAIGFNREDSLRSFGLLLRDGKIEKTGGGRFTASGEIGFRPDHHSAGWS